MELVFIYGAPAVGKLTVGLELAALTGFKVLHDHLTVNPLVAIFERNSPPYPRNAEEGARAYFEAVESRGGRVQELLSVLPTSMM
jgi:hypothetical protein